MRYVVLLFGFIAVIITGAVGWFYFEGSLGIIVGAYAPDPLREIALPLTALPADTPGGDIGVFVLLSAAYGLLGVLLAFGRCGWQGALLMIVPLATTAIMNPSLLAFTGLQLFVGLLAFFVFRLPLKVPAENRNDADRPKARRTNDALEDEWSGRGKSKGKSNRDNEDFEDEGPIKMKPKAPSKRKEDDDD